MKGLCETERYTMNSVGTDLKSFDFKS